MSMANPEEVFLVYDDTTPPELYYETPYGWYYARTLTKLNIEELSRTQSASADVPAGYPSDPQRILTLRQLLIYYSHVSSSPVFIKTTNNWMVSFADAHTFFLFPEPVYDEILNVIQFRIPTPSSITPDASHLQEVDSFPYDEQRLRELIRLSNNQLTFRHMQTVSPSPPVRRISTPPRLQRVRRTGRSMAAEPLFQELGPIESPNLSPVRPEPHQLIETSSMNTDIRNLKNSYETLISQLYSIPVDLPETLFVGFVPAKVISFEQGIQKLTNGEIERFLIDPMLQPWAGPPSSPNRIFSFYSRDGLIYLVKGRYDAINNQIYQPQ